jgi:hypothetical protein
MTVDGVRDGLVADVENKCDRTFGDYRRPAAFEHDYIIVVNYKESVRFDGVSKWILSLHRVYARYQRMRRDGIDVVIWGRMRRHVE